MTMHLARGLTTIRNRKYKPKMTKANIAKWEEGLRIKNKEHKRMGLPKWTFEQYVDYCHGIQPKVDPRSREAFKPMSTNRFESERAKDIREHAKNILVCLCLVAAVLKKMTLNGKKKSKKFANNTLSLLLTTKEHIKLLAKTTLKI